MNRLCNRHNYTFDTVFELCCFLRLTDIKSTESPPAMMQVAPNALQGQHPMLHSTSEGLGGEDVKPQASTLAQHHTTLHAMLSHGNHMTQPPSGAGPTTQHLQATDIATSIHPSGYSTHNPDVLAGLAPAPYNSMTSYTGATSDCTRIFCSLHQQRICSGSIQFTKSSSDGYQNCSCSSSRC